jgi:hypothetical protein
MTKLFVNGSRENFAVDIFSTKTHDSAEHSPGNVDLDIRSTYTTHLDPWVSISHTDNGEIIFYVYLSNYT